METLAEIAKKIKVCTECGLHQGRTQAVPGEGNTQAEIFFIGEGPGFTEDKRGRPFVGQAGKFLEEMLAIIALKREDVFISNVVKCRPPNNRDPSPDEVDICTRLYLQPQIALIRPKLIVLLGRHALGRFLPGLKISQVHGQPQWGKLPDGHEQLFYPLYHPAAALYQAALKQTLIEDFKRLPEVLKASFT
jgi:uracil-DNA glycosylase